MLHLYCVSFGMLSQVNLAKNGGNTLLFIALFTASPDFLAERGILCYNVTELLNDQSEGLCPKIGKEYLRVMKGTKVSDETLEFINLDDEDLYLADEEAIDEEAYEDEYYEDEDDADTDEYFEDEYYDTEEDEYYEDEDYEDEEEYDHEGSRSRNIFVRFGRYVANMSSLDRVIAIFGIFILSAAIVTGGIYVGARSSSDQVAAFAEIGGAMDGITVIGEGGLIALADAESMRMMVTVEESEEEEDEEIMSQEGSIEVTLNLTSIQSDIKIKFANKGTGKLISGVPFEVEISGKDGKKYELKDEDKDGIIYQNKVAAGTYTVKALALQGDEWKDYILPAVASTIDVTDTIAYKKVDVSDEIKKESEINAAVEDTAAQDTQVESQLTDTVEWVESTKTLIESDDSYGEIGKDQIPDPSTISALPAGFAKTVNAGTPGGNTAAGTIMPLTEQPGGDQDPVPPSCKCEKACTEASAEASGCPVCQNGGWEKCQFKEADQPKECQCAGKVKCTEGSRNPDCEACKNDITNCKGTEECKCEGSVKCTAVAVNSACPVCSSGDITKCKGKEKEPVTYSVEITSCPATLTVGGTGRATATGTPAGGTVTWSSSNSNVVTIDAAGNMKANAKGTATITATYNTATAYTTVIVEDVKYSAITLSGTNSVKVNGTAAVTGKTTPEGGTISWTSSNEKIVKIESSNGTTANFKGIAAGTAVITAKCGDASATWQVTVTNNLAADNQTKLKDKNGNQVYVIKDGKYVEATYADYYTADKFYLKKEKYFYTGWQTIDGYTYYFDKNGNYVTGDQVIQGAKYTFGSDGKLSSGSGTMGIDVSKHNGNIDWNAVKNSGVSFVIIRCGYRGSATGVLVEDPMFRSNIKGAKAAGLKVGVYFFCQAVSEAEAVEEASMAVSLVSGYGLDMPIFLDVESAGGRGDQISKETRTAVCKAFCQTVQNSGYSAGIYANKTWFNEKINVSSLTSYKIWLAQYASAPTYTTTRYDMWQYSSKGRISGISGNVDLDIRYY